MYVGKKQVQYIAMLYFLIITFPKHNNLSYRIFILIFKVLYDTCLNENSKFGIILKQRLFKCQNI